MDQIYYTFAWQRYNKQQSINVLAMLETATKVKKARPKKDNNLINFNAV